jgi:hypothetical protein
MAYDYIEVYEALLARSASDGAAKASHHLVANQRRRSAETAIAPD